MSIYKMAIFLYKMTFCNRQQHAYYASLLIQFTLL